MHNGDEDAFQLFPAKGEGFTLSEFLPVTLEEEGIEQESSEDDTKEHLVKTNSCASRIKQNSKGTNSGRASYGAERSKPPKRQFIELSDQVDEDLDAELEPYRRVID